MVRSCWAFGTAGAGIAAERAIVEECRATGARSEAVARGRVRVSWRLRRIVFESIREETKSRDEMYYAGSIFDSLNFFTPPLRRTLSAFCTARIDGESRKKSSVAENAHFAQFRSESTFERSTTTGATSE